MKRILGWTAALSLVAFVASATFRDEVERVLGRGSSSDVMGATAFLFMGTLFGAVFGPMVVEARSRARSRKYLLRHGKRMSARILHVQDAAMEAGTDIYVTITVRTVDDTEAVFKTYVPRIAVPKKGDTITVLYDPEDPSVAVAY